MTAVLLVLFMSAQPLQAQVDSGSILGDDCGRLGGADQWCQSHIDQRRHERHPLVHDWRGWSLQVHSTQDWQLQGDCNLPGIQTTTQTNITVDVGADVVINFSLKPGAVTQTVEVVATIPVLQRKTLRRSSRRLSQRE